MAMKSVATSFSPQNEQDDFDINGHSFFSNYFHFPDLLPLWDEENQHDKDFLKHHDEDVEDTLAQPRCALYWLSYTIHTPKRETDCLGIQILSTDQFQS